MKTKTILVTATFYSSIKDVRAQLAIKTCSAAKSYGYRIIVVDNSDCHLFKYALRDAGAIVIDQDIPGMGSSRRQAISAGIKMGSEVVVWFEPEKYTLIPLLDRCIEPVLEGVEDLVIPRRRSLDSYPNYQQWSEYAANWVIGNITGRPDLDLFFGTRVMSRDVANVFASYMSLDHHKVYGDEWETLFIPIMSCIGTHKIKSIIVDYVHPLEQLVEDDVEMRRKRDTQRNSIVKAMSKEAERLSFKGSNK